MQKIVWFCLAIFLAACTSVPTKMQSLNIGMAPDDVRQVMGKPDNLSVGPSEQIFYYKDSGMFGRWYFVKFSDLKVDSYGQVPLTPYQQQAMGQAAANLMSRPAYTPMPVYQVPVNRNSNFNCTTNQYGNTSYTNCN